ncbi:MAG UNVERIFIED_CONTAM: hypothetical protein LVT10_20610 [Anaerolineae bacterium]
MRFERTTTITAFYDHGQWNSPDEFFQSHGASAHSIALERILKHML